MNVIETSKDPEVEVETMNGCDEEEEEEAESSIERFLAELSMLKGLPSSRKTLASTGRSDEASSNSAMNDPESCEEYSANRGFRMQDIEWNISDVRERMEKASLYFDAWLEAEQKTGRRGRGDISILENTKRQNSQSQHPDPDFVESPASSSSHSAITSYILGQGMISRKIADSMLGGGAGGEGHHGEMQIKADAKIGEAEKAFGAVAKENEDGKVKNKDSETSEGGDDDKDESDPNKVDIDIDTNKITGDQVKLAAAATITMLVLMWIFEPQT